LDPQLSPGDIGRILQFLGNRSTQFCLEPLLSIGAFFKRLRVYSKLTSLLHLFCELVVVVSLFAADSSLLQIHF